MQNCIQIVNSKPYAGCDHLETKIRKKKFIITSIIALFCISIVCIIFIFLDKANDVNTLITDYSHRQAYEKTN